MEITSQTLGWPDAAALTADKWQLLNALTEVAESFGLSHRNLTVLKALMTFLPDRQIGTQAVVFPSNKTLATRLNGMPESTLRRHLATLVKTGLIQRRDSPNRKRFAQRIDGAGGIAFGFDLTPLAQSAVEILNRVRQARRLAQAHAVMRARLLDLCHRNPDHPNMPEIRKALRRRRNTAELNEWINTLEPTEGLSGTDAQNERHLQATEKKESVIERPSAEAIRKAHPSAEEFYPNEMRDWPSIHDVARKISPMLGIEDAVFREAQRYMGTSSASVTVLSMLERLTTIRNPGGYLRKLTQQAEIGRYTCPLGQRAGGLSSDNSKMHLKTTC